MAKKSARKGVVRRSATGTARSSRAPAPRQAGMGLHTAEGLRKYLTAGEREAFLRDAERADRAVRTLYMTLAYAGCRLSEALALTADRVDLAAGVLTFESLKKRRTGIYRSVPVPPALRLGRHPAQPGAEVARARPAHDHGNLCERGRRRGK